MYFRPISRITIALIWKRSSDTFLPMTMFIRTDKHGKLNSISKDRLFYTPINLLRDITLNNQPHTINWNYVEWDEIKDKIV